MPTYQFHDSFEQAMAQITLLLSVASEITLAGWEGAKLQERKQQSRDAAKTFKKIPLNQPQKDLINLLAQLSSDAFDQAVSHTDSQAINFFALRAVDEINALETSVKQGVFGTERIEASLTQLNMFRSIAVAKIKTEELLTRPSNKTGKEQLLVGTELKVLKCVPAITKDGKTTAGKCTVQVTRRHCQIINNTPICWDEHQEVEGVYDETNKCCKVTVDGAEYCVKDGGGIYIPG